MWTSTLSTALAMVLFTTRKSTLACRITCFSQVVQYASAKYGSLSCLELLVTLKAIDLNMRDRIDQDTPLHKAVQYKEDYDIAIAMVDQLLAAGADPR